MKRYEVQRLFWLTLAFILVGFFMIAVYFAQVTPQILSKPLSTMELYELQEGQYVRVTMDRYVNGKYGYVKATEYTLNGDYYVVVVPLKGRFVEVAIKDPDIMETLDEYNDEGMGPAVSFIAQVKKRLDTDPGSWYEKNTVISRNLICTDFQLYEVKASDSNTYLLTGLFTLLLGAVCFFTEGGIHKVYVHPFEDTSAYRECFLGKAYNIEGRLEREKKNLKNYLKEQENHVQFYLSGIAFVLGGIASIAFGFADIMHFLDLASLILGAYLSIYGLKWLWLGFLNSPRPVAYRISDKYLLRTLPVRISESRKLIAALEHGIEMQKTRYIQQHADDPAEVLEMMKNADAGAESLPGNSGDGAKLEKPGDLADNAKVDLRKKEDQKPDGQADHDEDDDAKNYSADGKYEPVAGMLKLTEDGIIMIGEEGGEKKSIEELLGMPSRQPEDKATDRKSAAGKRQIGKNQIAKKQFCGNTSLRTYVIPNGTTEVGDWAFYGCSSLWKVEMPISVDRIGKNAFAKCDRLERVCLYGEGIPEEKEDMPYRSELMASALRFFEGTSGLAAAARRGSDAWIDAWDWSFVGFLNEQDEKGFQPFLAGGEEDYEDDERMWEKYCREKSLLKAELLVKRLLMSSRSMSLYLPYLRESKTAPEILKKAWRDPGSVIRIFEMADLLTDENCRAVLKDLPEECVEMKALLLQRVSDKSMEPEELML